MSDINNQIIAQLTSIRDDIRDLRKETKETFIRVDKELGCVKDFQTGLKVKIAFISSLVGVVFTGIVSYFNK